MTERVDSIGDLEEEETDPRVKEVGSRNMASPLASRDMTRVMNIIGLSVCGVLFYLQIFWYTNKQLESHSLTKSFGLLSFVDIPTSHKTLKCQHRRRRR